MRSALFFGRLFDRVGITSLAIAALIASVFAPLVFLGNAPFAVVGMVLWGIGMGAQESITKAAVAGMVSPCYGLAAEQGQLDSNGKSGGCYGYARAADNLCW